jgi:hypothetical protein
MTTTTSDLVHADSERGAVVFDDDLTRWAYAARQAHGIARSLAETEFVPAALRNRPDSVCAAILAGRELGLSPMASLQAIDIVDGRPSMRAMGLRAIVQSLGHRIWVEETTDTRAVVCGQRSGRGLLAGPMPVERSTWTVDRARKAGLLNKRNWQNYPAAMLIARATAEVCRLIAADALLGMPYASEELDGDVMPAGLDAPDVAEAVKAPPKRRAQRAPALPAIKTVELPQEDVAPTFDDEPADEPAAEPADAVEMVTLPQMRKMQAAFRDLGVADRASRLAMVCTVVGNPNLSSSNELTKAEASAVIDLLEQQLGAVHIDDTAQDDNREWPPAPDTPDQ